MWSPPQYSVTGEALDRGLWIAAQITLMGAYVALNTMIQNKQYDIAKDYEAISKDKWERFRDKYAPLERRLLSEVSNTKEYDPDYAGARSRGVSATNQAFAQADSELATLAMRMALCLDPSLLNDTMRAKTRNDSVNFNYRDEENYARYRSDKRWNRRSDILNLGRGNSDTAFSYAQSASTAFGGVASALQQAGNGLSGLLGYLNNRAETIYPAQFAMAAPLGGGSTLLSGGSPHSSM